MIDLTGGHLAQFLLAELLPVISRHPRFRDNDGSALTSFSNLIAYKDLSLTIGNLRASGQRLSPDHFMCTALGRACVAKLEGHTGSFIEWIQETDPDQTLAPAGIYYFAVDAVDEATREVRLVQEAYRWQEGRTSSAVGSKLYLSSKIPQGVAAPSDPSTLYKDNGASLTLLSYSPTVDLIRTDTGASLIPGVDYWVELEERHVLLEHTGGPAERIPIPEDWISFKIMDQDEVEMRQGQDWEWDGEGTVRFAAWVLRGTYTLAGTFRRTPGGGNHVHPENYLTIPIAPEESLVAGQTCYTLIRGEFHDLIPVGSDRFVLGHLQEPGDRLRWEARVQTPQVYKTLHKMAVNPSVLPGVDVAVGDQVTVGDQLALIVFPRSCEVYEVYGGKDSVNFDITIRSNDLATSTELGSLVKAALLIESRNRLETLGLTLFEITTSYQGEARDSSGTSASHPVTLNVTGMADWEYHKPLVNRVDEIDVDFLPDVLTYPGAPRVAPALVAFGISRFTPSYQ